MMAFTPRARDMQFDLGEIDIANGNIRVFDALPQEEYDRCPAFHETESHWRQGFSRNAEEPFACAFYTLIDEGPANVVVFVGEAPKGDKLGKYSRVIGVPFEVDRGRLIVEGAPDDVDDPTTAAVPHGNYHLVVGQYEDSEGSLNIHLFFQKVDQLPQLDAAEIFIKWDGRTQASPPLEAIHEAEKIQFD